MADRIPRIRRKHHTGASIAVDRPVPGFFKTKRKSVWVPALVYESPARDPITGASMDRAPALLAIVDGLEACPYEVWGRLHPVTEPEYRRLCQEREGVPEGATRMNTAPRI